MKGDFSKLRFDATKHYHDVLMQQGRVMLDSDWNEQAAITTHRTETGTLDIIGSSGVPMHQAGFRILAADDTGTPVVNGRNLKILSGRLYADGIVCENEADVLFVSQPDYNGTPLPVAAGTYLFYLDVWQRHITVLEDTGIREVALGGPDTTTRSKTIWQVKYAGTRSITSGVNCLSNLPPGIIPLSTGLLGARPEQSTGTNDPCGLTASGGYRRLENQLYRVEVHTGGLTRVTTTFKWSRDNGSVAVKWNSIDSADASKLVVSSAGRDELLGFKTGNWIELIDDGTELAGKPGVLVQLSQVNGNVLTINPATIKDPDHAGATSVAISTRNPRIRRWDSDGMLELNSSDTEWVKLEDGVEVQFSEGIYKTGDYWLIPARTATANVEWPTYKDSSGRDQPLLLSAHGVQHHFCKLAIAEVDSTGQWTLKSDCRPLFPPITELTNLYYAGGDGQEAMPGNKLPATLKVGVANGQWAVAGAKIKFEVSPGGGTLNQAIVLTNPQGIAECEWTLGNNTTNLALQVKASLLDAANNVMQQQLPVIFNASFSIADNVFYNGGDCTKWDGQMPATVADALTALCKRESNKTGCTVSVGKGAQFETLNEAFDKLRQEKDICICLLPGQEHEVKDLSVTEKRTIKISGCGAFIIMTGKKFQLNALQILLQGFSFSAIESDNAQIALTAHEINVDHCRFTRKNDDKKTPFILVNGMVGNGEKFSVINLNNIHITASIALALGSGFRGWIKDNHMDGDLLLQYAEDFIQFKWMLASDERRKAVQQKLETVLSIKHNENELHIRGNTMNRAITNIKAQLDIPDIFLRDQQVSVPGYYSLIISENVFKGRSENAFEGNFSTFLAELISLNNNEFLNGKNNEIIAFALGKKGVITGNIDPLYNNDNGAIMETLFNRKIITPNLITVV